jgi:pimeloyl-ACP methyl ester carboxylesterase
MHQGGNTSTRNTEWSERLVFTDTDDGIMEAGVLIAPEQSSGSACVVWVHGAWMHFYFPTYVQIGRELARRGYPFLSVNTRGHDLGSLMFASGMEGDAAEFIGARVGGYLWETFDQQIPDMRAWISFALAQGFESVVLAGHSLGATRVFNYQSREQDPRVSAMIAASPAPLQAWEPDADQLALAQMMVAEGRGDAIMEPLAANPIPLRRTAQNLVVGQFELRGWADRMIGGIIRAQRAARLQILHSVLNSSRQPA